MVYLLVSLIFLSLRRLSGRPLIADSRLLTAWPAIISHDSVTGEIISERDGIKDSYSQTQKGGLTDQLSCGARWFDYRPYLIEITGDIIGHHGSFKVHKKLKDSIKEVRDWLTNHQEELVVFYMSHYDGGEDCPAATKKLLSDSSIFFIDNCNLLLNMTVSDAFIYGKQTTGGSLIAVFDCMDERYDPTVNCYSQDFTCYDSWPDNTKDIPWDHFKEYLRNSTSTNSSYLWMTQAHWQQSSVSTRYGHLHQSTVLLDESRSGVNEWFAGAIRQNLFEYLSLVEIDNVCDHGVDIYNALNDL